MRLDDQGRDCDRRHAHAHDHDHDHGNDQDQDQDQDQGPIDHDAARLGTIVPFDQGKRRVAPLRLVAADRAAARAPLHIDIARSSHEMTAPPPLRPTSTTTTTHGRAARPRPTIKEQPAMYGSNMGLNHLYAEARRSDLLAEVERQRRIKQAVATGAGSVTAIAGLRRAVGAALVRVGERVQGAAAARPADGYPSVATLRTAR